MPYTLKTNFMNVFFSLVIESLVLFYLKFKLSMAMGFPPQKSAEEKAIFGEKTPKFGLIYETEVEKERVTTNKPSSKTDDTEKEQSPPNLDDVNASELVHFPEQSKSSFVLLHAHLSVCLSICMFLICLYLMMTLQTVLINNLKRLVGLVVRV